MKRIVQHHQGRKIDSRVLQCIRTDGVTSHQMRKGLSNGHHSVKTAITKPATEGNFLSAGPTEDATRSVEARVLLPEIRKETGMCAATSVQPGAGGSREGTRQEKEQVWRLERRKPQHLYSRAT